MKNTKGIVGEILIFVVVVAIASGFVFVMYKSGEQMAAEALFSDDMSSVSLVADAVVNSPNCLLYTEKVSNQFISNRWVISWLKVLPLMSGCVRKGPYLWNVTVKDEINKEERSITGYSGCNELGKRSFPVIIKRPDGFSSGKATISVASKDAVAKFSREGNKIKMNLLNSGSCSSRFVYSPRVINKTTGELTDIDIGLSIKTENLEPKKTHEISYTLPNIDLSPYSLKIEIYPDGMNYYVKEYRIPL